VEFFLLSSSVFLLHLRWSELDGLDGLFHQI
jgi:hypothetical protein